MLEPTIVEIAEEVKEEITKSIEVKETMRLQQIMLADPTVRQALLRFQTAKSKYDDAIRYTLDIPSYQKELAEAKQVLYALPPVVSYLQALRSAQTMLREITKLIFEDTITDLNLEVSIFDR